MTVPELVAKLNAAEQRADAVARIIGYVVIIQHLGWDKVPLKRTARHNLEKALNLLEIDPFKVEF